MRHVVNGTEPGAAGVLDLVTRALELRAGAQARQFPGTRLGAVFLNPSLRTRSSLEAAARSLGIDPMIVTPGKDAWSLEFRPGAVMDADRTEHVADAVRVLASWCDVLSVRAFAGLQDAEEDRRDTVLSAFCRYSPVPVVSLESALWHPLQGLADTATWVSRLGPDLTGQPLTLTWAPHPKALPAAVANQALLSASLMGMDVTVAHPEGFDLDPQILGQATALAGAAGGGVRVVHDQHEAMVGARVVVAKSWSGFSGYGRRAEEAAQRSTLRSWTVDAETMAATDGAGFMHCLPVRRNVVVADEVIDGPDSWVYEEAGLRLHTAMALLEALLTRGDDSWSA